MQRTDSEAFSVGMFYNVEADDAVSDACEGLVAFLERSAVRGDQDGPGHMQSIGQQAWRLKVVSQNHHDPVESGLLIVKNHDQSSVTM
jgi:hypothetical protein